MKVRIFTLLLLLFSFSAFALPQQEISRYESLIKEIRCVVCQSQSIADSNAPLANDLRTKIFRMIEEQKTNTEIKDYLVKRYGDYILLQPRFAPTTWLLWLFPTLCFLITFALIIRYRKK